MGQTGCSIGRGKPGLAILYPIEVSEMKKIHIKEILFLLIISASILVASIAVIFKESTPEWQDYQAEFKEIVAENIGSADLSLIPRKIQSLIVTFLPATMSLTNGRRGLTPELMALIP